VPGLFLTQPWLGEQARQCMGEIAEGNEGIEMVDLVDLFVV
jgi:hypothetical protein